MMQIRTQRLLLRPAKSSDLEPLFGVYGDARAMRYWDRPPHESVEVTRGLLDGLMREAADTRYFVVEREGRAIGTGGFWQGDEVGFILHPACWRQGLGREVLEALVRFGFNDLGLERITADVDPRNAASLALLARVGFRETGREENTLKVGDAWVDSVYLEMVPPRG